MAKSVREMSESERIPGDKGIFTFIGCDLYIYALLFGSYVFARSYDVEGFREAQEALHPVFGLVNTLVLLLSSWMIATGVRAARSGQRERFRARLLGTLACGFVFSVLKITEYSIDMAQGIYLNTHEFYSYYYVMTGIHWTHVFIGMTVLAVIGLKARNYSDVSDGNYIYTLESGASYWHMVDIIWLVLFPLAYLVH